MGSYGKRKGNAGFAWEYIEKIREMQMIHWNLWKTQGKHRFCAGAFGKRNENTGFAREPIDNARKAQVLRSNLWKMYEN